MAFKMTEEEFMKMRAPKPPRPPAPKPPKRKPTTAPKRKPPKSPTYGKPKASPQKKKKPRYNPFKDGRTPTGASYTTGP
jgi:hypothetical protein